MVKFVDINTKMQNIMTGQIISIIRRKTINIYLARDDGEALETTS